MSNAVVEGRRTIKSGESPSRILEHYPPRMMFPVGTIVVLNHDLDETGVVVGYNRTKDGYYPSRRYPLLVRFSHGEVACSVDMIVRL